MRYCGPRGIPYTHFMGGPDVWDDVSRQLAIEWSLFEMGRCKTCGTHPAEWDEARGGNREAYRPELHRCPGDAALAGLEIPAGEEGVHKVLVPNLDLPMWGHLTR